MKRTATGLTLAAALSLTAFSAAPASAETVPQNCTDVYKLGYSHVPESHEWYKPRMDGNPGNGIGCENKGGEYKNLKRLDTPGANVSEGYHDPTDQALPDAAYTYPDCKDAYAAGVFNIPAASDDYHDDLDSDQDGVGCEYNVEYGVIVEGREEAAAEEISAIKAAAVQESESDDEDASDDEPQVTVVPEGTPDTGAEGTPLAPFAAGALALAAVAGTGVALRRRQA